MEIINKIPKIETLITGRMSDGSDRKIEQVTNYYIKAYHEGKIYQLVFDHDPKDDEILAEINQTQESVVPEDLYIAQVKYTLEEITGLVRKLEKVAEELSTTQSSLNSAINPIEITTK